MAKRPKHKPAAATTRVRHLVALDAANVMRRLEQRAGEMVALFSRLRDRAPMLETVHTWFDTAGFPELALLEPAEQAVINAFYEELGELRWYFEYTEDMPTTVHATTVARVKKLLEAHAKLVGIIGEPLAQGAPAVVAEVVVHPPPNDPTPAALPAAPPEKAKRNAR